MPRKRSFAESQLRLTQGSNATEERFIAFLDIMGFKERVIRYEHDDVLKELEIFQSSISQYIGFHRDANIQVSLFSDSILIYSQDDSIDSLHALADVTSHIMMYAIQQERPIPLKGAIAAGRMTCNQTKQLYFGQALIDAYLLEENVKYYGVLVHHSAEKYIHNGDFTEFRDINAPLKGGEILHYELNWYDTDITGNLERQKSVDLCLRNLRLTVSDEPRKYIDNTRKVMGNVQNNISK